MPPGRALTRGAALRSYSEIFWTAQPAVALPSDFVKKYDGKAISITGFEVDIVRHGGTPKEESVPSYQWCGRGCAAGAAPPRLGPAFRGRAPNTLKPGRLQ